MKEQTGNNGNSKRKNSGGGKIFAALCHIAGILLIVIVLAFGAALVIPAGFGYSIYNIMSGSMAPEIPVNSIIYVHPSEPEALAAGDVVVFDRVLEDGEYDLQGFIVAHRIVENHRVEGELITKGDANDSEDLLPVKYSAVKGKVIFHMPMLGRFMTIYTSLPGKICLIGVALCGLLLNILAGRIRDRFREKDDK